jgi:hypothetical protein
MGTVVFLVTVGILIAATVGAHVLATKGSFEDLPPLPRED